MFVYYAAWWGVVVALMELVSDEVFGRPRIEVPACLTRLATRRDLISNIRSKRPAIAGL
jgi:hypothetical protein